MEESQEQLLIADDRYAMILETTGNRLQSEEVIDESPLPPVSRILIISWKQSL